MNNIKSIAAAALLAVSGLTVSAQTMLNASYDVAREFYKEYNSAFVANYKKTTGKDLKIDQAHGGSSAQARAVNDGLDADVVTMNTTTDIEFLASKGIVAADWTKRFPHSASPTSSICELRLPFIKRCVCSKCCSCSHCPAATAFSNRRKGVCYTPLPITLLAAVGAQCLRP